MRKKTPFWIRAIEGTESGGSAGSSDASETNADDEEPEGDSGEADSVDWKARYEQAVQDAEKWKSHSRKWEERAKAKVEAEGESNDIRARLAEVEQNLKDARAEAQRAETERLKFALGAEFGLSKDDVDLLRGTEDEMRALAQRLGEKQAQHYPENPYQGRGGKGSAKSNAEAWAKELLGKDS